MRAQKASLQAKKKPYGAWSADPEMLLMPKTNFGSEVTEMQSQ